MTAETDKPKRRAKPKADAALTNFQSGKTIIIHRSELKNAPYNPRKLSPDAKRRLKEELKRNGYLDRCIWNRRSGFLVRGHQRLACLDDLEGHKNYLLEVTEVDMDEKQEAAANISGNNVMMHGEWDVPKLEETLTKFSLPAESMGFKPHEISHYFGISPAAQNLADLDEQIKRIDEFKESNEKLVRETDDANDPNFFLVCFLPSKNERGESHKFLAVFESHEHRKAFTDQLGLTDGRFQESRSLRLQCVVAEEDDGDWLAEGVVGADEAV